jgi:hypothetical protein
VNVAPVNVAYPDIPVIEPIAIELFGKLTDPLTLRPLEAVTRPPDVIVDDVFKVVP